METQVAKQKAFLTMAFGGPNDYSGKDMRNAHARFVKMGLGDSHFNVVMEHLSATLVDLSVPPASPESGRGRWRLAESTSPSP